MKEKIKYIEIPTIGEYLVEEWLEPLKMSQNALARAIGVPQNRINEIVNNKRGVSAETDLLLCRYFGMSDGFFTRMQSGFEETLARRKLKEKLAKIVPYDHGHANDDDEDEPELMRM
ncbi:MAG: HigA family addiction module antitoxin [Proteobacteria bacterium]|nr:HigA family addiction module antitoxin [Pseudomonadota bacterium]